MSWGREERPPLTDKDKAAFIQACFDDLFYYLERISLFLEKGFVKYEDVCSPLGYYAEQMAKDWTVYKAYMERIRAGRACCFLKCLEEERTKPSRDFVRCFIRCVREERRKANRFSDTPAGLRK